MAKAKRKSFKGKQTWEQTTNGVNENKMESEQQSVLFIYLFYLFNISLYTVKNHQVIYTQKMPCWPK